MRKQLLLAEANAHREQMERDLRVIQSALQALGGEIKFAGSIASMGALAAAGFAMFRRRRAPQGAQQKTGRILAPSNFLPKFLAGVRIASTLWDAWQASRRRERP